MPAAVIECFAGAAAVETLTLKDRSGAALAGYTSAATLAASLWDGADRAADFAPTAAWTTDATDGKVTITVSAAQTTTLAPGDYPIKLTITAGGVARSGAGPVAILRILAAPGTATAPAVYGTAADLLLYFPAAGELRDDADQAGFALQRARARAWLDEAIVARFSNGDCGWGWSLGSPGLGAGSFGPWSDPWPSQYLRDGLAAGWLVVTGLTREIVAKKALGYLLEGQITAATDDPYERLARRFHHQAAQLAKVYRAEIDSDADGETDIVVNLGATSLR